MNRITLLDSTFVRNVPIAVSFALAAVLVFAVRDISVTNFPEFDGSLALAAIAAGLATVPVMTIFGTVLFTVVPGIDLLAVALLGNSTGGGTSVFIALVVLPVLWLASSAGRRHLVYALVGSVIVLLAPVALDPGTPPSRGELIDLIVAFLVTASVALVGHIFAGADRHEMREAQSNEMLVIEEIDRAAAVQRSLWPDANALTADNISVAGRCLPATSVGGDFFDWYDTGDGVAITLGDVMGKGVGAGLIAAAVRAAVRSAHAVADPVEALLRASDGLEVAASTSDVTFTTLFHARLSNDGVLRWADAGHGLSAIIRSDGTVEHLATTNLPLGLNVGERWESNTAQLQPGDVLVSVSDGVLDLFDSVDEAIEGMNDVGRRDSEPEHIVATLVELAERVPHDDDVTVVAMRLEPVLDSRPQQQPPQTVSA